MAKMQRTDRRGSTPLRSVQNDGSIGPSPTESFANNLPSRHRSARLWHVVFLASTIVGIVVLTALLFNILNSAFGLAAVQVSVDPATLVVDGLPIEDHRKSSWCRSYRTI